MEIKARYRLIGLFMLMVMGLGFGFVYWLQNAGGLGERKTYTIHFQNTVGGLRIGAPVFFNGIKVGEVTGLTLSRDNPHLIIATISVDKPTPLRADTSVRIDFQGLVGTAAVSLNGGSPSLPKLNTMPEPPALSAGPGAGEGLTDMARQALGRLDKLLADNSTDLHDTIGNFKTFSATLAKNSDRLDTIISGLEKTFAAPPKPPMAIFDLTAPQKFPPLKQPPQGQLAIADPTTILIFDTQQILLKPQQGPTRAIPNAQWGDSLPKLIQEKVIQSFENAHYLSAVARPLDALAADYQLLIDLRTFDIGLTPSPHAEIDFVAKILAKDGKIIGARLFHAEAPASADDAPGAAAALNEAFGKAATDLVGWAAPLVFENKPSAKGKPVQGKLE